MHLFVNLDFNLYNLSFNACANFDKIEMLFHPPLDIKVAQHV